MIKVVMIPNLNSETSLIPPALLQRVLDLASAEHRLASDVLRDAIESYLQGRRSVAPLGLKTLEPQPRLTPGETVARKFELRKGNVLPEGETIKDLINFGRS